MLRHGLRILPNLVHHVAILNLEMTIHKSFNGLCLFVCLFLFLDTEVPLEFYTSTTFFKSRQLETTSICTILNYLLVLNVHTLILT